MQLSIAGEKLTLLRDWFKDYVHTFREKEPELQGYMDLKEKHTMGVCREISHIGRQLRLNDDELKLSEIIALLHDVGRFEQYARYRTFIDWRSENHAELGIQILGKSGVLEAFDNPIKEIIHRAIRYHNRRSLPREEQEPYLFYAKLIRDADKLDIWKILIDHYYSTEKKENGAIELELPDTPGFSEDVYHHLIDKRIVDMKHVKNLNDFKLLQIGWIFDINFQPTLDNVNERRYLKKLRDVLPESKKIDEIFHGIHKSNLMCRRA